MVTTIIDEQPWMIVQEKADVYDKLPAFAFCDRRQHLFILNYKANKNAPASSTSSTISVSDSPSTNKGGSTHTIDVETVSKFNFSFQIKRYFYLVVVCLERIQYIQRGGGGTPRRSARSYSQLRLQQQHSQNEHYDRQQKQLEIYYMTDNPRSEYLYKSIIFQIKKSGLSRF
jgi:hypothetical protein